jgi:large subunit ribosomal protein L10
MLIRGAYALRIFLLPTVTNETGKVNRMARPDKTTAVAELAEDFRTANATVLTEYRGLSVTSMKELRRALGTTTKYSVVKNTLTKIAAKDAGVEIADDLLTGPSAVAFIKGDPIDAAKSLRDFAKENPFLVIKGGFYEGKPVTPAEIMQLANLESREVLLAKLAGAMKGSLAKAARIFDALRIKLEAEQGAPAPVAEAAPAAEAVVEAEQGTPAVAEVPVVETPAEAVVEAPAAEAVAPEVVAEVAEVPAAEATEASTETEEKE